MLLTQQSWVRISMFRFRFMLNSRAKCSEEERCCFRESARHQIEPETRFRFTPIVPSQHVTLYGTKISCRKDHNLPNEWTKLSLLRRCKATPCRDISTPSSIAPKFEPSRSFRRQECRTFKQEQKTNLSIPV